MTRVSVIGAGSWGTAVAWMLGGKDIPTMLWARSPEVVAGITAERTNPWYLTDLRLPDTVVATADLEHAVRGADVLVLGTPSRGVRDIVTRIAEFYDGQAVVSLAKGLEVGSLLRMTEVAAEVLGPKERMAALSGPNHAEEVSRGIPSATVIAAYDEDLGRELQDVFMTPTFRVYTNTDVVGVELSGASKNVIAVAAGISDGLGFGDNTKATLMTRGLAEMSRLGRHMNANPLTYMGLAGMGDLIATCTSQHSRNRAFGQAVAAGGTVERFERETHMVAEGATAALTVDELGRRIGVELPITHHVRAVVHEGLPPTAAVPGLMQRDAVDELHGMGLVEE